MCVNRRDPVERLRSERGGVLVMAVIWLPVLVLMITFVVDVANWFEHKRHLQMQADAAALAAAGEVRIPCTDQPIIDMAKNYSGDQYNAQIGGTPASNVHMEINSKTWYGQASPTDDTVNTAPPCTASMIDVKLTETDLPWFFRAAQVPFINAHARVSIVEARTADGALPVGVPDVNPKTARAIFVDEITGNVIGSRELKRLPGLLNNLAVWDNTESPLPVTIDSSRIGVRIALGGGTSSTCGEALVECYDLDPDSNELLYIRGWSADEDGAQPNAPKARSVTLFPGSCSDPYFSASSASCTIGVRATVDFGTGTADPVTAVGAKLTAVVNGNSYPLTYDPAAGTWQSSATIPIAAGAGPVPVELRWEETSGTQGGNTCTTSGGNKCKGTFGTVQRAFGAIEDRSGPIKLAQVEENGAAWSNSFERCSAVQTSCTHDLVVRIGVQGSLKDAQSVNDPVVSLRVVGGSQNQSLDCDPNVSKLKDELAQGCVPSYTKNSGSGCPASASALWASPQPWSCVALQTGTAVNQVPAGLNRRILGTESPTSCTAPNNWSSFPNLPLGDPRIVQVFLTPYGSFQGSGSDTVPVSDFATFYVTGWTAQGQGFANPCQGNGDDPVPGNDAGYIVGHFIKYVKVLNNGGGGDELCDLSQVGLCYAVLTE
jgi:Flp pilus assembly protein TadG